MTNKEKLILFLKIKSALFDAKIDFEEKELADPYRRLRAHLDRIIKRLEQIV